MTKKDYELIARVLQGAKAQVQLTQACGLMLDPKAVVNWIGVMLAGTLEKDNPRFDRERFLKATEPGSNVCPE